jgi:hypothetical protein
VEEDGRTRVYHGTILVVEELRHRDEGVYQCQVEGDGGDVAYVEACLSIPSENFYRGRMTPNSLPKVLSATIASSFSPALNFQIDRV